MGVYDCTLPLILTAHSSPALHVTQRNGDGGDASTVLGIMLTRFFEPEPTAAEVTSSSSALDASSRSSRRYSIGSGMDDSMMSTSSTAGDVTSMSGDGVGPSFLRRLHKCLELFFAAFAAGWPNQADGAANRNLLAGALSPTLSAILDAPPKAAEAMVPLDKVVDHLINLVAAEEEATGATGPVEGQAGNEGCATPSITSPQAQLGITLAIEANCLGVNETAELRSLCKVKSLLDPLVCKRVWPPMDLAANTKCFSRIHSPMVAQ